MPTSLESKCVPRTLVVAPSPDVARCVTDWLTASGHEIVLVADFHAAKAKLTSREADLLVSEVKLGAFNGLHLAILAASQGPIPTILIGDPDPVLEMEARRQAVRYVTQPLTCDAFLKAASMSRRSAF